MGTVTWMKKEHIENILNEFDFGATAISIKDIRLAFDEDSFEIMFEMKTRKDVVTGKPGKIYSSMFVESYLSPDLIVDKVHRQAKNMWLHEFDEQVLYAGKNVVNPHPELLNPEQKE